MSDRANRTGIYELLQSPELEDLIRVAVRNAALEMRTHTMCTVTSYDPVLQTVAVTVDMRQRIKDPSKLPTAADPNPTFLQLPAPLKGIPVAWPKTRKGYVTFELETGDRGELHVQDRAVDGYVPTGLPAEPARHWTHNLADSVFHPTTIHATGAITPPTSIAGTVIEGTLVKLGRNADDPAMKGTPWAVYVAAVSVAYAVWLSTVPPTPTSNGIFLGVIGAANEVLQLAPNTWLSTKVQVE